MTNLTLLRAITPCLLAFAMFLGLSNTTTAQTGGVGLTVDSLATQVPFPDGSGFGDFMTISLDLSGSVTGCTYVDFVMDPTSASSGTANMLMVEYPTEVEYNSIWYDITYEGMDLGGVEGAHMRATESTSNFQKNGIMGGVLTLVFIDPLWFPSLKTNTSGDNLSDSRGRCRHFYTMDIEEVLGHGAAGEMPLGGFGDKAYVGKCKVKPISTSALIQNKLAIETTKTSVSPNPFVDRLTLSFVQGSIREISVRDLQGKIIYSGGIEEHQTGTQVEVPNLPNGVYLITITGADFVETRKLIKAN